MVVNTEDPNLYSNLALIVDAFEKEAIGSGDRAGFMAVANSPLSGMDMILEGSERALTAIQERSFESSQQKGDGPTKAQKSLQAGVELDQDLLDIMFPDGVEGESNPAKDWIKECLGCDFRLKFDWQLKPINLLGPIEDLLGSIRMALDSFSARIDEFKSLKNLCGLLNHLKGFCLPDLLAILMSLKMLLKKYSMAALDIKLDWTVVLGPLLKAILDGIVGLITNLSGVLLAPLDCSIASLTAANSVEREARSIGNTVNAILNGGLDLETNLGFPVKDVEWNNTGKSQQSNAPSFGHAQVTKRQPGKDQAPEGSLTLPPHFEFNAATTLDEALVDPLFSTATLLDSLLIPLHEARAYVLDLTNNITSSLNSLNLLCSGGLGVSLTNLGVLLFLADMISLVMMIIRLLRSKKGVTDWCAHLAENPKEVEELLRSAGYRNASVKQISPEDGNSDQVGLVLMNGPELVGELISCSNKRSELDTAMLDQWIAELEGARK